MTTLPRRLLAVGSLSVVSVLVPESPVAAAYWSTYHRAAAPLPVHPAYASSSGGAFDMSIWIADLPTCGTGTRRITVESETELLHDLQTTGCGSTGGDEWHDDARSTCATLTSGTHHANCKILRQSDR